MKRQAAASAKDVINSVYMRWEHWQEQGLGEGEREGEGEEEEEGLGCWAAGGA